MKMQLNMISYFYEMPIFDDDDVNLKNLINIKFTKYN